MLQTKKSLGQHFLTDPNYIGKITKTALEAEAATHVEIGPGAGALTDKLYAGADHLVLIETDQRMIEELKRRYPKAEVMAVDVLDFDWQQLSDRAPLAVTGNLPYNISSPILFQLLDNRLLLDQAVVMLQKEVADRILAKPSTKAYGILSVQFQLFFGVERLFNVPPTVFRPPPKVDSTVLRLKPKTGFDPEVPEAFLRTLIRRAFARRRKTLQNNLKSVYDVEPLSEELRSRRAESLSPDEFVAMAKRLYSRKDEKQ